MRLTVERIRTLVLAAGILLLVALAAFLTVARWKSRFNFREVPQRLGINIQQEGSGITYTQSSAGHTLFKLHASKVIQLKKGNALLHDVQIELYGADGRSVDRIACNEFEYDQKAGIATAAGPVDITITRPPAAGVDGRPGSVKIAPGTVARAADSGQIHVKTSGVTFDQKTGIATTAQHVEFDLTQGAGSSTGASFDSQQGHIVLDRAVQLNIRRGADVVVIHAAHGEFERGAQTCLMANAAMSFKGGEADAGLAQILFREDGSAEHVDASGGVVLVSQSGSKVTAPAGQLELNEKSQPLRGRLQGGVSLASDHDGRQVQGSSPIADLAFNGDGLLEHMHLEGGVRLHSAQAASSGKGPLHVEREWHSPVADLQFREVGKKSELATAVGTGGVVITGQSQRGAGPLSPSRMAADVVTAQFGSAQQLSEVLGQGHARVEQVTEAGVRQTTSADRLDAHMLPAEARTGVAGGAGSARGVAANGGAPQGSSQIEDAVFDGNVVMTNEPAAKPGQPAPATLRATGGHAVYVASGQRLTLTIQPRVEDGGMQMSADQLDVFHATNEAVAQGNVKATWVGDAGAGQGAGKAVAGKAEAGNVGGPGVPGGSGITHAVSQQANLNQGTGVVTFRGQARLWQQANAVAAPEITLDRTRRTLVARTTNAKEPVQVVLVRAGGGSVETPKKADASSKANAATKNPSVVRIAAGDLYYSDAERMADLHGGVLGRVTAQTIDGVSTSDRMQVFLTAAANHAGPGGGQGQLDRLIETGNVTITTDGRRGTGQKLVYAAATGDYTLTGTAAKPPTMVDAQRGTVTGAAFIFNARDDSVSVEGAGTQTSTTTTAPK